MTTGELLLRPAQPNDADEAAPLIYAAGPTLFGLMFGPDPAAVQKLFAALFRRRENPFSHEHASVAERNGALVGLALAGTAARRRAVGWRMPLLLLRFGSPLGLLRAAPRIRDIMACTTAPPPGAYYLSILAVAEGQRSRGIGARLMAQVCHDAARAGCKVVALHAESDNRRAQEFYRRQGFTVTEEHAARPKLAAAGVSGLTAMRREV